jgi:hypothetical protein
MVGSRRVARSNPPVCNLEAIFRMSRIAGGAEMVCAFVRGELVEQGADASPEAVSGTLSRLAQQPLSWQRPSRSGE